MPTLRQSFAKSLIRQHEARSLVSQRLVWIVQTTACRRGRRDASRRWREAGPVQP